jgi:hypothetical protein
MNELHEAASVHTILARGVTCHRCGVHYEASEWQCLPLSQRLEASELRTLVLNWSERHCIEVRSCAHCQTTIAAKRSSPEPATV